MGTVKETGLQDSAVPKLAILSTACSDCKRTTFSPGRNSTEQERTSWDCCEAVGPAVYFTFCRSCGKSSSSKARKPNQETVLNSECSCASPGQ